VPETYTVSVSAGSLTTDTKHTWHLPHRWTREGVSVEALFTGAHLLHVAVAGCVLNDLYREAEQLAIVLDGARVTASGGFDKGWNSTGIGYDVQLDSSAEPVLLETLLARVDKVAEIPRTLRVGTSVSRG
jgi:hypothetical protein